MRYVSLQTLIFTSFSTFTFTLPHPHPSAPAPAPPAPPSSLTPTNYPRPASPHSTTNEHTMSTPETRPRPALTALLAMSTHLSLPPMILARALEYAFDNQSLFPSANQALCFGIIRQGYCIDVQRVGAAVQWVRWN
jgi:hypothetical protein